MLAYLNLSQNALLHTILESHEVIICDRERAEPGVGDLEIVLLMLQICGFSSLGFVFLNYK